MKLLNTIGWVALAALVLTEAASAQSGYTAVTATVTDVSGNPYAGGRYQITFVYQGAAGNKPLLSGSVFQQQVSGSLDSSGKLAVSLADNNSVTPGPSQWNFQICAASGTPCFSALLTITGSSQDISSALTAVAPPLHAFSGGTVFGGITATGLIQAQSIEQVRYADQFAGADIFAKVNAAETDIGSNNGIVVIPPGVYNSVSTTLTVNNGIVLEAYGAVVSYTGGGDAIHVNPCQIVPYQCGEIRGLWLNGNANSNAVGIHIVSSIGFIIQDSVVENFTGASSAGIWVDNQGNGQFAERTKLLSDSIYGCTKGVRFTNTSGTNSVGYTDIEHTEIEVLAGQIGMSVEGSVSLYHSNIDAKILLFVPASSPATTAVSVTGGASLSNDQINLFGENATGVSGYTGLAVDATSSVRGVGFIDWSNLTNNFASGATVEIDPPAVLTAAANAPAVASTGIDLKASFATNDPVLTTGSSTVSGVPCFFDFSQLGVANIGCLDASGNLGLASGAYGNFFSTANASPAQSGVLRLANADLIAWRNASNTADITLGAPASSGNVATTAQLPLAGTTASIGGSALAAGLCTTGTVAVTNATTAMAVAVSPAADPGTGFAWEGWVSAAGTVTVRLCNVTAGSLTPTAEAYNVRVIQ